MWALREIPILPREPLLLGEPDAVDDDGQRAAGQALANDSRIAHVERSVNLPGEIVRGRMRQTQAPLGSTQGLAIETDKDLSRLVDDERRGQRRGVNAAVDLCRGLDVEGCTPQARVRPPRGLDLEAARPRSESQDVEEEVPGGEHLGTETEHETPCLPFVQERATPSLSPHSPSTPTLPIAKITQDLGFPRVAH